MKKAIQAHDPLDLQRRYPLADLVEGWFFRCEETSAGCWRVEGIDVWGRTVSATGFDSDSLIARCVSDAKEINTHLELVKGDTEC